MSLRRSSHTHLPHLRADEDRVAPTPRGARRSRRPWAFTAALAFVFAAGCGVAIEGTEPADPPLDGGGERDGGPGPGPGQLDAAPSDAGEGGAADDAGTDPLDGGDDLDAGDDADAGDDLDAGDDAGDGGGDIDPPPGPLTPSYVDFDINHVLVTGQSNAVATGANPPLTLAPLPGHGNLRFDTGVMPMNNCDGSGCKTYDAPASFLPLAEGDRFYSGTPVETSASGIGYEASLLAKAEYDFGIDPAYPARHDVLVSVHGRSGNTYWCLRKGACNYKGGYLSPFAQAMSEVESAKALATGLGKSYVVRAAVTIHGESDHAGYFQNNGNHPEFPLRGTDGTPNKIKDYADALIEWQEDYESSVKAITGQAVPVPLLVSGLSGWTAPNGTPPEKARRSELVQMQLDAHIRAPGKVVLVTPGYPLDVRNDCLHFSAEGSRRLGEYFGKVYARIVFGGETWEPVRPKSIARAGNVITVKYHVPRPPLVIDTVNVSAAPNFGFDVYDGGARVAVSSVTVADDTVTIALAAPPAGANMRLTYAQNLVVGGCIGPGIKYAGGARGNVRDSDDSPSAFGNPLWNWGVNFDLPIP